MSGLMSMVERYATLFTSAPAFSIANQKSSTAICVSAVPANDVQNQLTELTKQMSALALHVSQLSSLSTFTLQCFSCGEFGETSQLRINELPASLLISVYLQENRP
jgi:hypothetical protein